MSDDEVDQELLELLRQRLGISSAVTDEVPRETGVLSDAEYVNNNAIDVLVDMYGTKAAAATIYQTMQDRGYSPSTWQQHELHPKTHEGFAQTDLANFVFTMDMLNFSFWSELDEESRFQVEYRGKRWTGYNSLVACLRRALDEGVPITTPRFWRSRHCSDEVLRHVFRSATDEPMPLLDQRIRMIREAGDVLHEVFGADQDDGNEDEDDEDDEFYDCTSEPAIHRRGQSISATAALAGDPRIANDAGSIPKLQDANGLHGHHEDVAATNVAGIGSAPSLDVHGIAARDAQTHTSNLSATASIEPASNSTASYPETTVAGHGVKPDPADAIQARTPVEVLVESIPAHLRLPDHTVVRLVQEAKGSAGRLVNLLTKHFPLFQDVVRFEGRKIRFFKRAQIFVADLWAAFACSDLGEFDDVDHLTMFADYRVPQILHDLGVLSFSPPLEHFIRDLKVLEPGHPWEVQLRIWAVELIRREIVKQHPRAQVNAVLLDFFLYDLAKEREAQGAPTFPHHRTRSSWY